MKIKDVIAKLDKEKPNQYSLEEKIAWLSEVDGRIKKEIIDAYIGADNINFTPYTINDMDRELLVPFPYDDLYIRWLEAMIDYSNGEIGKYNNSMTMFNAKYSSFSSYYNRNHVHKATRVRYF